MMKYKKLRDNNILKKGDIIINDGKRYRKISVPTCNGALTIIESTIFYDTLWKNIKVRDYDGYVIRKASK